MVHQGGRIGVADPAQGFGQHRLVDEHVRAPRKRDQRLARPRVAREDEGAAGRVEAIGAGRHGIMIDRRAAHPDARRREDRARHYLLCPDQRRQRRPAFLADAQGDIDRIGRELRLDHARHRRRPIDRDRRPQSGAPGQAQQRAEACDMIGMVVGDEDVRKRVERDPGLDQPASDAIRTVDHERRAVDDQQVRGRGAEARGRRPALGAEQDQAAAARRRGLGEERRGDHARPSREQVAARIFLSHPLTSSSVEPALSIARFLGRRRFAMPAKSAAQQKAAGAALSAKRGDTPKSELKGASRHMVEFDDREGARGIRLDQAQGQARACRRLSDRHEVHVTPGSTRGPPSYHPRRKEGDAGSSPA